MSGHRVRTTRQQLGLTQQSAAEAWGVSQTYLSLMESGRRPVPEHLVRRLARVAPEAATGLRPSASAVRPDRLDRALGRLGFPGFAHLASGERVNHPASVVLRAVTEANVPARVLEALPWLLVQFADMNWQWLVDQAKLANRQNRLGYLVHLARQLAERSEATSTVKALTAVETQLRDARLLRTDTFREDMTNAEREYLQQHRPEAAGFWNVLTRLTVEQLRYAS